ncbi:phospholipase D/transphosphatidylase [Methylobacterium oxalidis]|uniref:Phospholipase D n=1 Tax=Methylobacterium oxalidis TaxID=944322 RepID=A0A512JCZ3_9HYPH|nr:phospholipase D/transphosphatidylase [Methylobacterium oxalidis]GLS64880.1 phospholipase D/transphosphatidylase [Methylobacterium oxalidis]
MLVDCADYFAAVKVALEQARRSVLIVGWSFDPRTQLTPSPDGQHEPNAIGDVLRTLKAKRPEIEIRLLIWDMVWPLSASREFTPERIRSELGPGIQYVLDSTLPFGACHHQKIVLVDDQLAFCGGSDFETNRWDTPAHRDIEPCRRLPSSQSYPPRHDVMMLVDGPAARALADLARQRWRRATGENLQPVEERPHPGLWPEGLQPTLADTEIGIVRTLPAFPEQAAVRESEALYRAAIAAAHEVIYLESQYFTSSSIADALAARLQEADGPEVVVIVSEHSPNLFDRATMDTARRALLAGLQRADRYGRLRVCAPRTEGGRPILVHSKVAVFDDWLLRVGSSNLNNRSFGYDTECDLALEAAPDQVELRHAIRRIRDSLLAHHAGLPAGEFGGAVRASGSVTAALDDVTMSSPRRLCSLVPSRFGWLEKLVARWHLGDPMSAEDAWRPWRRRRGAVVGAVAGRAHLWAVSAGAGPVAYVLVGCEGLLW